MRSSIIVSGDTSTNDPRANHTPLVTVNADPIDVAFEDIAVAKSDPFDIVVLP